MNQFESLCKLASDETWCWDLCCTTCGHMHFRYAFLELATGKSPTDSHWLIHKNTSFSNQLGSLPRNYTGEQKEIIHKICCEANIGIIESSCKFPDWLGYLGLILEHMHSGSKTYTELSSSWASQLIELVTSQSLIHARLQEIVEGNGVLNIKDLEECESNIMHNKYIDQW
jgi:hypothetical protein